MNQNALKGMLIMLVIFDHNEYAHKMFPLFLQGFSFHVVGFMSIPFLRAINPLEKKTLEKLFFSYYYPFFWIVCGMAILNVILNRYLSNAVISNLLLALYSANASILKIVTQMSLLWFLPSFLALILIRSIVMERSKPVQLIAIVGFFALHLWVGHVALRIQNYLPLGLLPAIYIFPLALIIIKIHQSLFEKLARVPALIGILIVFVIVKYWQIRLGLSQETGFAEVADYQNLTALVVNDLEAIFGTLLLFQIARFNLSKLFENLGKNSMQVYLFHAFVALIIYKILEKTIPAIPMSALLLISMCLTMLITIYVARVVMRNNLSKQLLFPRSWRELTSR